MKIEIGQNTRALCLLADRWEDDGETMRGSGVGARGVGNRLVIAPTTNPGQSRYFAPLVLVFDLNIPIFHHFYTFWLEIAPTTNPGQSRYFALHLS